MTEYYIHPIVDSLRSERLRQGKSMRGVAKIMGVSNSSVKDWEDGLKSPTLNSLQKWADALEVDIVLQFTGFNREIDESLARFNQVKVKE